MLGHLAFGTGGKYDVQYKERRPAQDESEEDQAQDLGCLLLRCHCVCRETVALGAIVQKSGGRNHFENWIIWTTRTYLKLSVGVATRLKGSLKGSSLWRRTPVARVWPIVVVVTCCWLSLPLPGPLPLPVPPPCAWTVAMFILFGPPSPAPPPLMQLVVATVAPPVTLPPPPPLPFPFVA